jgi:hypothetical protein
VTFCNKWVYGYDQDGQRLGRAASFDHMPTDRHRSTCYMVVRRKTGWHVFELNQPSEAPIPEKVITRLWMDGQGDLTFPTRYAAETFLALRGRQN